MDKSILKSLIFNILEVYFIACIGVGLGIETNYIAMLFLIFFISRFTFKSALHYRKWYLCALWSASIFLTLFILLKQDIAISLLSAVFMAYVVSGASNIQDMFMFKKKDDSKYKALDQFILFNYDDERLLRFENHMKKTDTLKYNLYVLRFKKNLTWDEMEEKTNTSRKKINSELDIIYNVLKYNLSLDEED